eukprot:1189929-Prorocentrum_minimum.AAC.2
MSRHMDLSLHLLATRHVTKRVAKADDTPEGARSVGRVTLSGCPSSCHLAAIQVTHPPRPPPNSAPNRSPSSAPPQPPHHTYPRNAPPRSQPDAPRLPGHPDTDYQGTLTPTTRAP